MNLNVSHTYRIIGNRMYPNARQGGLSRVGHAVPEVDGIIVVQHGEERYVVIFGDEGPLESVTEALKKTIPDVELVSNELGQAAYKASREKQADAMLFFDRETYV